MLVFVDPAVPWPGKAYNATHLKEVFAQPVSLTHLDLTAHKYHLFHTYITPTWNEHFFKG